MSIPFPSARRTSAKGPADKPRRVRLVCPACGEHFSLNYAEYYKHIRAGTRPTDSRRCAWMWRRMQQAEKAVPA